MKNRNGARWAAVVFLGAGIWLAACGDETSTVEATLSGGEEVPPVSTSATGTATATLEEDILTVTGSFSGLGSDLAPVSGSSAHVHRAPRGEAGPIVFNLNVTPGADNRSGAYSGSASLSTEDQQNFRDGRLYVNVHTTTYPMGEIRGQLEP